MVKEIGSGGDSGRTPFGRKSYCVFVAGNEFRAGSKEVIPKVN